jgi:hypothetical protein
VHGFCNDLHDYPRHSRKSCDVVGVAAGIFNYSQAHQLVTIHNFQFTIRLARWACSIVVETWACPVSPRRSGLAPSQPWNINPYPAILPASTCLCVRRGKPTSLQMYPFFVSIICVDAGKKNNRCMAFATTCTTFHDTAGSRVMSWVSMQGFSIIRKLINPSQCTIFNYSPAHQPVKIHN